MLGTPVGAPLVPRLAHVTLLEHIHASYTQARGASWKPRATAPSRSERSSGSSSSRTDRDSSSSSRRGRGGSSSRDSGSRWGDSAFDRQRDGSSGSRGRGSSRGSRDSYPRQQRQQRESRFESVVGSAGDEDDWRADSYDNDSYSRDYDRDYDDGDYKYPPRPSKATYKEQLFGEALYGVAPILAALQAGSRTPHVLLMQEGISPQQRKDARALADIQRLAKAKGTAIRTVSKHELNMLSGNRPHQGLVLDASPLSWEHMDVLPMPEEVLQQQQQQGDESSQQQQQGSSSSSTFPVWLALDEVIDPQNLGALLRSAYCLGASGVLGCSKNCAPLSPVVSKASAGAVELMVLHSCRSMPRTLADAAAKGWAVLGAAAEEGAVPVSQVRVDRPTVLVMGNEGYGLRATVKRCCTQLVQIEMAPQGSSSSSISSRHQLVDSLNVSVATGILLHQLLTTARQ